MNSCSMLPDEFSNRGLLKKAVSGVLAIFPCLRSTSTLALKNGCGLAERTFLNRPEASYNQRFIGEMRPLISALFDIPNRIVVQPTAGTK